MDNSLAASFIHKLGAKSEMHQTASKEIRGSLEGVGEWAVNGDGGNVSDSDGGSDSGSGIMIQVGSGTVW